MHRSHLLFQVTLCREPDVDPFSKGADVCVRPEQAVCFEAEGLAGIISISIHRLANAAVSEALRAVAEEFLHASVTTNVRQLKEQWRSISPHTIRSAGKRWIDILSALEHHAGIGNRSSSVLELSTGGRMRSAVVGADRAHVPHGCAPQQCADSVRCQLNCPQLSPIALCHICSG